MFKVYFITALVFIVAWTVAWFMFIHPLLQKYALTSGLMARIDAAEGDVWTKTKLWFEAKKTLAVTFFMSLFAAGKAATDQAQTVGVKVVDTVTNLTPDAITPLQDKTLWSSFFSDIWSLHIVAALSLLAAFLTLKGKVQAAQLPPKA